MEINGKQVKFMDRSSILNESKRYLVLVVSEKTAAESLRGVTWVRA